MSERKKTAYTPNMETPSVKKSGRGKLGVALSLLLPPVGIAFLWRRGVFRARGRLLITAIATLEMAVVLALLLPTEGITPVSPAAVVPVSATVASSDGVVTALSNMDQLLAEQQAAEAALNATEAPQKDLSEVERYNAEQQAILDSYVYSVFNNAKLYHSRQECEEQTNRRTLTVAEALNEGMGACPNCDPPVFKGFQ